MTGAQSLVIAGSAVVGMGALVAGVWRARWRAAHTVVARAPMLARLPVLDQTTGFAPVAGFPPWEPAPRPLWEAAGGLLFGDDRGGWVSGTCAGGPGEQWPGPDSEPPPLDGPPSLAEDGSPLEELDGSPLDELPEWTEDELARLHDAPTVFDVGWVESWLSDGWADRMAAEIRTWKVGL